MSDLSDWLGITAACTLGVAAGVGAHDGIVGSLVALGTIFAFLALSAMHES